MMAYHIKQWHPLYERADTRKTDYMSWYAKQTKLVGLGIGYTMQQSNNLELLGGWYLLEVLASQSALEYRGWLVRNGKPLTPQGMSSLIPTVRAETFEALLKHFSSPEVDWLELVEWHPTGNLPGISPTAKEAVRKTPGSSPGDIPTGGKNSATDRQIDINKQTDTHGMPGVSDSAPPALEGARNMASALGLPADYGEHYWRKKQEAPVYWFDHKQRLINWPQQMKNRFQEDENDPASEWNKKKARAGAQSGDFESRLAAADLGELERMYRESEDPEKSRRIRERMRAL